MNIYDLYHGKKIRMTVIKKLLAYALGVMMIALTPAVVNAAGLIEAECGDSQESITFIFDIVGGKQFIAELGEAEILFTEDSIVARRKDGTAVWKFKEDKLIDAKGREMPFKCKYKNLELIEQALQKKDKKPLTTSVEQRLQALEERIEKLESYIKK